MTYDIIDLDRSSDVPMYQQLYKCIGKAIENGYLPKGTRLPSIRRLSSDLSVSRTTVEAAYDQLLVEGYIASRPQSGYFIQTPPVPFSERSGKREVLQGKGKDIPVRFDLSSSTIDSESADIRLWRSYIKDVLSGYEALVSYGEPQGEYELRRELALYAYSVRGVECSPENIVIGAGTQQLLYILCRLLHNYGETAAIEQDGFFKAEQVFSDCGYNINHVSGDNEGIQVNDLYNSKARILFVNPSESPVTGQPMRMSRRYELIEYAQHCNGFVIEDDYNGELRFSSRPIPAMQGIDPNRVIYLGSFSKLLLPSVRVGYAVLPDSLTPEYKKIADVYNQTASKVEQLALSKYIHDGKLDKRLRRLRKVYNEKSVLLTEALNRFFGDDIQITMFENSLCINADLPSCSGGLVSAAADRGLRITLLSDDNEKLRLRLGFAGIPMGDIVPAAELLAEIYYSMRKN